MAESELYQKGKALRRELLGAAYVDRRDQIADDPIMRQFGELTTETIFGALWARPGLDFKTRALVTVVSDVATGREPELALHLRVARRNGWSEEELTEVLFHLMGYVGAPLVREAIITAIRVFAEVRQEGDRAAG